MREDPGGRDQRGGHAAEQGAEKVAVVNTGSGVIWPAITASRTCRVDSQPSPSASAATLTAAKLAMASRPCARPLGRRLPPAEHDAQRVELGRAAR
jgi:hypothetical protein